jgi:hypothetical protein
MKEQFVWACECGATVKYSDSEHQIELCKNKINSESRELITKLINLHKNKGHEIVEPYQANAIRRELKKCPAARN